MEHIVQFGVSIDDNVIQERIVENVSAKLIDDIEAQAKSVLFNRYNQDLSLYSKAIFENFLDKHKDELLEKAAVILADKLARSKRGKEILESI